jgi:hypothetical protein
MKKITYSCPCLKTSLITRQPGLHKGLVKINERLARFQLDQKETSTPIDAGPTHPAIDNDVLQQLRLEVEALATDLRTLKHSTASKEHHLDETVNRLVKDQQQLSTAWERMRNELPKIKVSRQKFKQFVNDKIDLHGKSRPFTSSVQTKRQSVPRPTISELMMASEAGANRISTTSARASASSTRMERLPDTGLTVTVWIDDDSWGGKGASEAFNVRNSRRARS